MFTFAQKPQSIAKVLTDTLRLYKTCFKQVWYWSLLFFIIPTLSTLFKPEQIETMPVGILILLAVVSVIGSLNVIFGECFIFNRMHHIATQADTSVRPSLKIALRKVWPVLGATFFIIFFILFGIIFSGIIGAFAGNNVMYVVGIIIFVYIAISFAFTTPFILLQNASILTSLQDSLRLVRGHRWRTFGVFFPIGLLCIIILLSVSFMITPLLTQSLFIPVSAIAGLLVNSLISPLLYAVILVQFYDLKARK